VLSDAVSKCIQVVIPTLGKKFEASLEVQSQTRWFSDRTPEIGLMVNVSQKLVLVKQ
jgi:hypothetical protein